MDKNIVIPSYTVQNFDDLITISTGYGDEYIEITLIDRTGKYGREIAQVCTEVERCSRDLVERLMSIKDGAT